MSFRVKEYDIKTEKIFSLGMRIVFLSDLHLTEHGKKNEKLLQKIYDLEPDLVLVGGDMVVGKKNCPVTIAEELMQALAKRYPVYYALGNHEQRMKMKQEWFGDQYPEYYKTLVNAGVRVLDNDRADLTLNGNKLAVYGLNLSLRNYKRFNRAELPYEKMEKCLAKPDSDRYNILLAHHPRFAKAYFSWGADLILSGHVHGGVMRLGKQPVISPDFQLFPKYGYGHFFNGTSHMLVSGGLGEHTIPFRIFNPKELVCINLNK